MSLVWAGGSANLCWMAPTCGRVLVVEHDGAVYACDHFVFQRFRIGNIAQTPLAELVVSPAVEQFARLKTELPSACRACEYLRFCRGGCPKHHVPVETLDPNRTNYFCGAYKAFFAEAIGELSVIAENIKAGRPPLDRAKPAAPQAPLGPASGPRLAPPASAGGVRTGATQPAGAPARNAPCPCGSGRKFKHCCGR